MSMTPAATSFSSSSSLLHSTVFEDKSLITTVLPFTEALKSYHREGNFENGFHLVEDPLITKKAIILGMFVLRPAITSWIQPVIDKTIPSTLSESIYSIEHEWSFNCRGFEGGWLIANKNSVDAYRLAMQYAQSDAVLIGTNTISIEGVRTEECPGYIWQPYALCQWDQLKNSDPELEEKFAAQRSHWQQLGYLSARKYPAQIAFTWSGEHFEGSRDFLEGRIFHETLPDGRPMEVYIITSSLGATRIRQRAAKYGLEDRIEQILIVSSPASDLGQLTTNIDLAALPTILHDKLGMKIVNHDGGHKVLREFCKAGIIPQMNLTLCRKLSVKDVVTEMPGLDSSKKEKVLSNFEDSMQYFFSSKTSSGLYVRSVPRDLKVAAILQDEKDEVAVVTFFTKGGFDFFAE